MSRAITQDLEQGPKPMSDEKVDYSKQIDSDLKMNLSFFCADDHFSYIKSWLKERNLPQIEIGDLPKWGFICFANKEPTCAGFLRMCEGDYAILDSLITNPLAPSIHRHHCIDFLVEHLIKIAKMIGIKQIVAFSVDESTLERSKKHGFYQSGYTVIVKKV